MEPARAGGNPPVSPQATMDLRARHGSGPLAGTNKFLVTGGATIDLREAATGRVFFRLDPPRPPVRALEVDARTGDLLVTDASASVHVDARTGDLSFTDASASVHVVSLADLHRAFRDLALDLPGFPFTSHGLLPSRVAEEVLGEPRAGPTGRIGPTKEETSRPPGQDDIPRVWSDLGNMTPLMGGGMR